MSAKPAEWTKYDFSDLERRLLRDEPVDPKVVASLRVEAELQRIRNKLSWVIWLLVVIAVWTVFR